MKKIVWIIGLMLLMMPLSLADKDITITTQDVRGKDGTVAVSGHDFTDYHVKSKLSGHAITRIVGDDDLTDTVEADVNWDQGQSGFQIQALKATKIKPYHWARAQLNIRTMGSAYLTGSPSYSNGLTATYDGWVHYYHRTWTQDEDGRVWYDVMRDIYPVTYSMTYDMSTMMTTISGTIWDGSEFGKSFSISNAMSWSVRRQ